MNVYLAQKNAHDRDECIQFFDEGHIYDINGDRTFTSVTSIVSQYYEHFDADLILQKMRKSGKMNNPTNKYYDMSDEEIKEQWRLAGESASSLGSIMHFNIECFYNNNPMPNSDMPELDHHFSAFQRMHVLPLRLIPYRTEWFVFDEEAKIAGSIDMVFQDPDDSDKLYIYDWKRTVELKRENRFQSMHSPLDHLPDTNYWHYCMQLNIYCYLLETFYKKKIAGMNLVVLHQQNESFIVAEVPRMQELVQEIIRRQRDKVLCLPREETSDVNSNI